MKLRISPMLLNDALAIATQVAPSRATIPALTCVKLHAKKAGDRVVLEVQATDTELGIRYFVPVEELSQEGALVVPAARFSAIIRELKDSAIEISTDGSLGLVKTQDSSFKVLGMDEAEFPTLPEFDKTNSVSVETRNLNEMNRKTSFAVSNEAARITLTGQLLEIRGDDMRMVSSDGRRLAYVRRKCNGKATGKDLKVIVPTKTMNLLTKILTAEDESIALNVEETNIKMATSRAVIFSRLIEGQFPDYEAVIPKTNDKRVSIEREPFLNALRKASLMAQDKMRAVKLSFRKGKITLYARSQELGEANVEMPIEYAGSNFDIVFISDYLMDYLKSVDQDKVEVALGSPTSAGLFTTPDDYTYVLMPLAIDSV